MKKSFLNKYYLWSIFVLLFSFSLCAQSDNDYSAYYSLCNEATMLKLNKEYRKAINKYEAAFELCYPFLDDLAELKDCYKSLNDTLMVKKTLERMILTGYTRSCKSYLIVPDHILLEERQRTSPYISKDEEDIFNNINYDSLRLVFMANKDNEKQQYLQAIITIESFVAEMRHYNDAMDKENDTLFIAQEVGFMTKGRLFMNLARSNKLPSRKESSLWEDEMFLIGLVHTALSFKGYEFNEFIDTLKQNMLIGNMSPAQYAILYDAQFLYNDSIGSYYGTSRSFNEEFEQWEIATPIDIRAVDYRRAKIFLPPLWVNAKQKNIILPKEYKPQY
jgi:hypothetical protein